MICFLGFLLTLLILPLYISTDSHDDIYCTDSHHIITRKKLSGLFSTIILQFKITFNKIFKDELLWLGVDLNDSFKEYINFVYSEYANERWFYKYKIDMIYR